MQPDRFSGGQRRAALRVVGASVAGSLRTMTRETQRLTNRLREEALMDDLTGLLNRRGWESAGRRDLSRARREGTPAVLVMLDLDGLKARLEDATPQKASFSTGVAVWDRSEDLDDLVRRGDLALYEAKAAGGGQLAMVSKPIGEAGPAGPAGPTRT